MEKEEIIALINKGYDLDLISFELDIPMEELIQYKNESKLNTRYKQLVTKYEHENAENSKDYTHRNLLAFAYFMSGDVDKAREELLKIVNEADNFTAYRQMVHIEKTENNMDEAKLWAYEALDKFPESIKIREQLISIAKEERDEHEIEKQLKEIIALQPQNEKYRNMLIEYMQGER